MSIAIQSEVVSGSKPKRFRENGRLHYNVRIFLSATNDSELDNIVNVQYELHPTFKERIRVADNRLDNFEIRIWSYGFFVIRAKIFSKSGSKDIVEGYIKWGISHQSE